MARAVGQRQQDVQHLGFEREKMLDATRPVRHGAEYISNSI
jgi:hypothetical protein